MHDERTRPSPTQTRIKWARGMSNDDICDFLQGKLLESRAERGSSVALLNELVHEIKHRLSVTEYDFRRARRSYDDGSGGEED
jgi:hypothetical protein